MCGGEDAANGKNIQRKAAKKAKFFSGRLNLDETRIFSKPVRAEISVENITRVCL
jgi:hypothetical protein